ncbi:MAG: hypothetical protein ABI660_01040 [Polaromonas sp.]
MPAWPLVSLALMALAGCQGMYLHQPDRAATATTAKKNIDLVDVQAITKTENDNLAAMLKQEVKGIETLANQSASLSVIQMSSSEQSIARHYQVAIEKMKAARGEGSMLELKTAGQCPALKKTDAETAERERQRMAVYGFTTTEACSTSMPLTIMAPADLSATDKASLTAIYTAYLGHCAGSLRACVRNDAQEDLEQAKTEAATRAKTAKKLEGDIKLARSAYAAAAKANADKTKNAAATEADLNEKAKKLANLLSSLEKASPESAHRIHAEALLDLLNSAASGQPVAGNPDLETASKIAATLPSLADSVEAARAASRQVPVSHLLLSLNNLLVLGERDDRLADLEKERLGALQRKVDNSVQQDRLWRRYSDQLCNLVLAASNQPHPNHSCDTIAFEGPDNDPVCVVTVEGKAAQRIKPCVLGKSWRTLFKGGLKDGQAGARRALYEAAAAYLQVRLIAQRPVIDDFNILDVQYRKAVIEKEANLQQWKNVVAIPAGELEGYYSGGVKPAEIADLLVKAAGFTAVAIGVSK